MRVDDHIRARLDGEAVRRAVVRPGGLWHAVEVTEVTGSTNADLLARARAGAPEGLVLVAEEQRAGRGRLDRAWVSPPRAGLTFSLLLRPGDVPPARRGWLPLLAGLAVAGAARDVAGVRARLKWPNDVLAGPGPGPGSAKLAGILAEAVDGAVVAGVGVNVSTTPAELPPPRPGGPPATSLAALGAPRAEREPLLAGILLGVERWYQAWRQAGGDAVRCGLHAEYSRACATLGREVTVELPAGQPQSGLALSGLAVGVDPDGRLVVRAPSGAESPVAAGDVVHLR